MKNRMLKSFKDYNTFIVDENNTQRNSAIETALSQVKAKYGKDLDSFVKNVKEDGRVEECKDFILKIVEPYIDRITGQDKVQTGRPYSISLDDLLRGCISWIIVELQIQREEENKKKKD